MKSIILSILFIFVGIIFFFVGTVFFSGKIRNTMLGKISGVFSLIMGVLTIASGVLIAIFPERTEILALVYLAVLSVLLIIMIILTNKLNK